VKPIILGLSPSGEKLWRILNRYRPISKQEYEAAFDFRSTELGGTVFVLDDEIRRRLGLRKLFLHPQRLSGVTYRYCQFDNNETNRMLVSMAMLEEINRW
jgi:hypothetical protein